MNKETNRSLISMKGVRRNGEERRHFRFETTTDLTHLTPVAFKT